MQISAQELWKLNFYRNSELHGALLMGRMARTLSDTTLLAAATRHCATEAHHATMLSELIVAVGGAIDVRVPTIQEHYSKLGGVPAALVDLLVLSEVLEKRVLTTYRAHVAQADIHPMVKQTLTAILREMEEEDHGDEESWLEAALDAQPRDRVEAAERKWRGIDASAVAELTRQLDARVATGAAPR